MKAWDVANRDWEMGRWGDGEMGRWGDGGLSDEGTERQEIGRLGRWALENILKLKRKVTQRAQRPTEVHGEEVT